MNNFVTYLDEVFWQPYIFETYSLVLTFWESQLCIILFARKLGKRTHFPARMALSLIAGTGFCYMMAAFNTMSGTLSFRVICYLAIAIYNLGITWGCYHDSIENILLSSCSGIAAYQLTNKLYPLIQNILGINDRETISLFHSAAVEIRNWEWLVFFFYHIAMFCLLSGIFHQKGELSRDKKTSRNVTLLAVITLLTVNVLICIARTYEAESMALNIVVKIFCIGFGFVILLACAGIFSENEREHQIAILNQLWKQDRAQFESVKARMDAINMKCHDLKHILHKIEGKLTEEEVGSLQEAIQFYDANIKTGNEVLDVVLCEKAMMCRENGIRFSCMVDGKGLSFLTPVQTYTLFGNIIDNAVEAVQQLPQPENKVIILSCLVNEGQLVIEESNYFSGALHLIDGLPATVKEDSSRHGFGTKSIKYIAEQYGGHMEMRAENDMFFLNVCFPLQAEAAV